MKSFWGGRDLWFRISEKRQIITDDICFQFCLLFILWGQGSSKGFASISACYLFYEVKVLPKDLLPVLLVIYSMRSRFFQRFCFQFCLLFILWGQGSFKGFASSSACYLFHEVKVLPKDLLLVLLVIYSTRSRFFQKICFQFCLLFNLWDQGSSKGFASRSACYLFYEVKILPKDLLPVLLVIYSMWSRFFSKDLPPVLLVIYSMRSRFFKRICFQICLLFILWGQGSSKGFASRFACYLFFEVKVLPKDLLPVLLVIYSMRSRFFSKDLPPVLLVIYSMKSRFFQSLLPVLLVIYSMWSRFFQRFCFQFCFQRICFQFCVLFILWGQVSSKGFASSSTCYLFYEVKVRLRDCVLCIIFWPGLTDPEGDRRTCEPVSWPPEAGEAASWGPCGWARSWPSRGYRSSGTWSSREFQSCHILIIFSSSAIDQFIRSCHVHTCKHGLIN